MDTLGVYVSTLNEEFFIEDTLRDVVKVFPQVEVIDLGSTDFTLECLNRFGIPVHRHTMPVKKYKHDPNNAGQEWTNLKNHYAAKHDWVLFIDGDEIYNDENLLKMKELAGDETFTAYRVGWKTMRETPDGGLQVAKTIINGTKLYKTSDYKFHRGWPNEVLKAKRGAHNKQPKGDCDVWCWHGVLFPRTNSIPEARQRRKKRIGKLANYETLEWEDSHKWPWM
jgi:glycosyltransferase involved in cell wall biosynthesis